MEEYIKKAATLIAELTKRAKCNNIRAELDRSAFMAGRAEEDKDILAFLNTLKEVKEKEVDLEEEIENELERTWYGEYLDTDKFKESAVYFYELGLKAKGK